MEDYKETITLFREIEVNGRTDQNISLSFEVLGGINMAEFHRYMKRFAIACGYSPQLVDEYFGEDQYDF